MSNNIQLIQGGCQSPSNSSTRYGCLNGGAFTLGSTESRVAGIASASGTIRNLKVYVSSSPGSGNSWDITLLKNGTATDITVHIADSDTTGEYIGDISVDAGDTLSIRTAPTSSPTSPVGLNWSTEFISTSNETLLMSAHANGTATDELYCSVIGDVDSTPNEIYTELLVPCPGTIKKLYVRANLASGSGKTHTFVVRKNGVDQTLTTTISGDSQVTNSDLVNTFSVVSGDVITIYRSGDVGASRYNNFGLVFEPTTVGNFILGCVNAANKLNVASVIYQTPNMAGSAWNATEDNKKQIASAFTIKNIYVKLSGTPSASQTFTLRKNSSASSLAAVLTTSDSVGNASLDVAIADNDFIDTHKNSSSQELYYAISYTGYKIQLTTVQETINSDAKVLVGRVGEDISSDSIVKAITQQPINSNAGIKVLASQKDLTSDSKVVVRAEDTLAADAFILHRSVETITSDSKILNSVQQEISSDTKIINVRQQDILADAVISERKQENLSSAGLIKQIVTDTINSDSKLVLRGTEIITSDAAIKHIEDTEVLSDSKIVARESVEATSDGFVKAVKYFYGQIKAKTSSIKNFIAQMHIVQPTPINPTSVVLTDLQMGDSIEISWINSGNYGYNVYKDVGGAWTKLNPTPLVGATSYIVGALVTNITYSFKVVGVNGIGTESSGVTGSKAPSFNSSHYTNVAYQIYVDGVLLSDVVLDTIELVFGPQYSSTKFHINKLPTTAGLPIANKQIVTVFIRNRLVFTGYLIKRENTWSSQALQVSYTAIDKSFQYTWTTPICEGWIGGGFSYNSDGLINTILRGLGLPTGLPIKNSLQNSQYYDQTFREIMSSFSSECGSWFTYTDANGITSYYEYGHPLVQRVYTLGINILEYKDTTDVTDQIDQVMVRSSGTGSYLVENVEVAPTIAGLLVASAEMDDVVSPNSSGSPIYSSYEPSIPQPWLAGPNGWTRAGITSLADYIQTQYDTKPFIAFRVSGGGAITNLKIEAFVNDRPEITEPKLNSTGQPIEVTPASVGLTTWATGTTEARPCANTIMKYGNSWRPVSAQTIEQGGAIYIRIDDIPVQFVPRIQHTMKTFNTIDGAGNKVVKTSEVMYMEEPWQRIAPIRIAYTKAFSFYETGSYGTGLVKRSQTSDAYGTLEDRAHEIYSRLQHSEVQGTMTILGDETLTLRTRVNNLEIVRITHDFSSGFRTHIDLTTPQNLYVLEVEKNYRDQVISRDINKTTIQLDSSGSTNLYSAAGGKSQEKKRDIRTSSASWGD